ncbi:MAG: DUF262 domain-containing protein [Cyanobacteria bacterium SBC]|nr:DUF262 domain-containing protein [Cyanobacteria bacterium SBC]
MSNQEDSSPEFMVREALIDLEDFDKLNDEEIEIQDEGINEPFDPTQIRVDTRTLTIDLVLSRIQHQELDLTPDFQRKDDIWNDDVKSRLIESILIRIPLPAFYIDATDDEKWLIIDGLQRLTALKKFIIDKSLKLTGLQYLEDLNNKNYDEIPRKYQRRLSETQLILYVIGEGTPPEVKYNIFRRINTGGTPLSPQEIRHSLNQGKATKLLLKLADSPEFNRVTNLSKRKKRRMIDREFVLGFLAFTIQDYRAYEKYKSRDGFLVNAMTQVNKHLSDNEIEKLEYDFKKAMNAAYDIFGEKAFRKISSNSARKYPLNEALFEVWSSSLGKSSDRELKILMQKKEMLIEKFSSLIDNNPDFLKSISQASQKIETRFQTIENLIREVLNA